MKIVLGNEAIRSWRRLSYKAWYAFAEFVDNSTQSFFDNKEVLKRVLAEEGRQLEVYITYDSKLKVIRIVDNAMGMNEQDLVNSLYIGRPPQNVSGRSEYGLGMKTAASWFGNVWSVTTKKLGEREELSVVVNVDKVAEGQDDLELRRLEKPEDQHYTIIEISLLNHFLNGWAIKNTREFLASMFREDLRDGFLDLRFNDNKLETPFTPDDSSFLVRLDETPYKAIVNTTIGGKPVTGYVGVMRPGVASRRLAGFNVVRRGRCVQGWLDAWRPEDIFGAGGRNDLVNQRLTGELVVDEFTASHTKDAILWQNDEEEELIKYLQQVANEHELIHVARHHRGEDAVVASASEREAAREQMRATMTSPDMVDAINVEEVPPAELESIVAEPLQVAASGDEPDVTIPLGGDLRVEIYWHEGHINDPYYTYWIVESGSLKVAINESHPGYTELENAAAIVAYSKHCAFDAIAEWKCRLKQSSVQPESVKQIKDHYYRVSAAIEAK
ncbi:ATP-binding protein [Micromonospora cremea]|uniref:Histidine kinase-, DNA gyrase B-, and HSP90-like ATPase n=1 Tax=Micromonospora cremea TaxID=709881 RepID=A0A1N6ANE3_9ACTN|nr:ATP-binding protein [Micromonospora cremea]SIN35504.1 Histidine kinase-, DNA gyrase B-, and HSP90-like ATPase [Micromonospora cremea]